tara:strand:+ start:6460 stop:7017 length:558 start_codon:yes stop_codon:yes gene_type:complete
MGSKRVGLARTEALIENLKRELSGLRYQTKYVTTTTDQDFSDLTGNTTILVNAAIADGKYIRLPEATAANAGMHIQVIFAVAPAATALVGVVDSFLVGGASAHSDGTATGHCSTNTAIAVSAVGTENHRVELDVDAAGKAGGAAGTILDFWYTGAANVIIYRGNLIGNVDTATLATHFAATAVNA